MVKSFKLDSGEALAIKSKEGSANFWIENDYGNKIVLLRKDIAGLKKVLEEAEQIFSRKAYSLWQGDHGTFISELTKEEDLPRITVGASGKYEKFKRVGQAFYKTKTGGFETA